MPEPQINLTGAQFLSMLGYFANSEIDDRDVVAFREPQGRVEIKVISGGVVVDEVLLELDGESV